MSTREALPEPRLITTVRDLAHTKLALYDAEQMRDYAVAYAAAQTAELRAELDAARAVLAEKPVQIAAQEGTKP